MHSRFCDYIQQLRQNKGLDERALAKLVSSYGYPVSQGTINNLQNGKISEIKAGLLISLSKALNVHPMKLIYAYQGLDPDTVDDTAATDDLSAAILEVLASRGKVIPAPPLKIAPKKPQQ